ncbi:phosphoribosyl transferase [Pyxidicoccus parkwayensis]|uniref:Phosphoribosyl transferase n=1 Tax=Pyxidicoccus parkwayensis TaxID=2813578 RepID=A0ABX7NSP8_9BACT|nr:phosphoribosyltransferase family protein [Pyxidicoccus parkwaysis]QSQ21914.1 phosphoribosyl transferase [Pyxidicoccus parkwaysis]
MRFRDRMEGGRRLASLLLPYRGGNDVVLGLARGGMLVAYEVARALEAPLQVWVARKVDLPGRRLTLGAVSEGDGLYMDPDALRLSPRLEPMFRNLANDTRADIESEVQRLRAQTFLELGGRTVLLVDDALVTGASAAAALQALRKQRPGRLILATPVATPHALEVVRPLANAVHCVRTISALGSVSEAYDDSRPVPDAEVRRLLERSREPPLPLEVLVSTDPGGFWM